MIAFQLANIIAGLPIEIGVEPVRRIIAFWIITALANFFFARLRL
jgi:hypothetical protein